jgi:8-oxo-dGTP pyrophosphatase MutT (NUDIX family)
VTRQELRAWIGGKLDPIEGYDPAAAPRRRGAFETLISPDTLIRPAAVLVPLVEHDSGLTVLLTRRADALRNHSGQIAFPGGRCDPGELPWQTALREAEEEIGLDPAHVTLAGLSSVYRTGTGFDITPVIGFVEPGFTLTANPGEVADIFETPFAFLMDPENHQRRVWRQADGGTRHYYAMTHEDREIWGATAGMLRELYERLYGAPPLAEG